MPQARTGHEAGTDAAAGLQHTAAKKAKAVYKPARCDVCSKIFYKRSNLRVHMLRHLGARPHWCQKCGKTFSDPSTYSRHVASVCGEQRHLTCHVCGKAFYHQVHLKEHLRKHTGEKPYSCQECGKSYACQGSLRRHRAGQCTASRRRRRQLRLRRLSQDLPLA
ncbi:zinc finger protein 135-like [Pollicipes pollicipes]|uniref:zinc finger protein 135-like n=1 Tax=Pollicipes pollicipes TaxID=41117 RepID=UPI001884DC28|nr:zinc finger protein 135-like [Pollicipes pollicipes]